jgi:integrase
VVTKSVSGDVVDPRAGRITLATVYKSWLASRLDLSPKVRRGYEDIWRLRIETRFGGRSVGKIDHESIQKCRRADPGVWPSRRRGVATGLGFGRTR